MKKLSELYEYIFEEINEMKWISPMKWTKYGSGNVLKIHEIPSDQDRWVLSRTSI